VGLGLRPFMTMMSQNSQSNGQPRENWIDIVAYCRRSTRSHRGTGVLLTSGKPCPDWYVAWSRPDCMSRTTSSMMS
jgi:hypothetical protein